MAKTNDPDISIGRDDAKVAPQPPQEEDAKGGHHPLPDSEKARHGSIPESVERERDRGAN